MVYIKKTMNEVERLAGYLKGRDAKLLQRCMAHSEEAQRVAIAADGILDEETRLATLDVLGNSYGHWFSSIFHSVRQQDTQSGCFKQFSPRVDFLSEKLVKFINRVLFL